jgi:hypothetical protein
MKNRYEKETFSKIVEKSINLSDVCRNLGLKPYYGNRQSVKKYIDEYKLDVSHFRFNVNNGKRHKRELNEIMIEYSVYDTTTLKKRLYKEGLKERRCELCGQGEEWNNMKISLILDHINGINTDNRIENLRIVCPNCNAGLDTHGGKNTGNGKRYDYSTGLIEEKKYFCKCGNEKSKNSKKCKKCSDIKQRKVERPDKETLLKDIEVLGYTGTGRKYGVSDNAIRKWIKKYKECEV